MWLVLFNYTIEVLKNMLSSVNHLETHESHMELNEDAQRWTYLQDIG